MKMNFEAMEYESNLKVMEYENDFGNVRIEKGHVQFCSLAP